MFYYLLRSIVRNSLDNADQLFPSFTHNDSYIEQDLILHTGGRNMRNKLHLIVSLSLLLGFFFLPEVNLAAESAQNETLPSQNMLKIQPGMSPTVLAGRPDNELVLLPSGRKISIGKLHKFSAIAKKLRQIKNQPLKPALKYRAAASGIQVKNSADLSAALQRSDSETVRLPSGKMVTVELLRYLQPEVEKRIGQKMAETSANPDFGSKPIKIERTTDKEYWRDILLKPDSTVLETPDGQRITVGELKLSLGGSSPRSRGKNTSPIPSKKQ